MTTKYFVKNIIVHKYPAPNSCNVTYEEQTLYDNKEEAYIHANRYCDRCFPELPK